MRRLPLTVLHPPECSHIVSGGVARGLGSDHTVNRLETEGDGLLRGVQAIPVKHRPVLGGPPIGTTDGWPPEHRQHFMTCLVHRRSVASARKCASAP